MKPSWLYQQQSVWIVAAFFVAMILTDELGRHWYP